jgi:hypothetical protein
MFVRACHWSLYWARCIHSTSSHPISQRSIPLLASYICLGLLSGLFPSGFLTKILYTFLISPMHTTCLAQLILLDLIIVTIFGKIYKLWSSSLCSFLQPPTTSSLLGPNVFLSTLFSNARNLCSYLSEKDHVSHPYKTRGKIKILERRQENKILY